MLKFNPITGQFDLVGASSSGGGIGGTTGAINNAIFVADGTGGNKGKGSLVIIGDLGQIILPSSLTAITGTGDWGLGAGGTDIYFGSNLVIFYKVPVPNGTMDLGNSGNPWRGLYIGSSYLVGDSNTLALRNGANGQTLIVSRTFTDASNKSEFQTVVTGSVVAFTISELGTGVGTLTGYTFDKSVTAPNIPVVDTGWTANADSGDKTAVIGSTATLDGIATALNLVTAGAGTQLENIAQKVKAIEAVLVALKLPNA